MDTRVTGMVLIATKCIRPDVAAQWAAWYPSFVASLVGGPVALASAWALVDPPPPGGPGPGHTHLTRLDLSTAVDHAADAVDAVLQARRAEGDVHPAHGEIDRTLWAGHGGRRRSSGADAEARAMIAAEVLCADPSREAEWDTWYDEQHLPDMLASGAFTAGSRWRRMPPRPGGANHLTIYEIAHLSSEEAVARSAAIMPRLTAEGRRHECHTGGRTMVLERMR